MPPGRAEHHRAQDTDPHPPERLGLLALAQERRHDADDQRGLEALSQADHEGGQHLGALLLVVAPRPGIKVRHTLVKGSRPCATPPSRFPTPPTVTGVSGSAPWQPTGC